MSPKSISSSSYTASGSSTLVSATGFAGFTELDAAF